MSNKRILKAYERFDYNGKVVPGSLVLRDRIPKNGKWKEVQAYLCCNNNLPSNCIEFILNTTSEDTLLDMDIAVSDNITYTVDWGDGTTDSGSLSTGSTNLQYEFSSLNTAYTIRICFSDASLVTELYFLGNS